MNWQFGAVCLFLTLSGHTQWTKASSICSPFPQPDSTRCSSNDRQRPSFKDLANQLSDAVDNEHSLPFVVGTILSLYKFLHPCASDVESALRLFYDEHSTVPDHTASWWQEMSQAMNTPLVGRRRRQNHSHHHYTSDDDLLSKNLQALLSETGRDAGCVQYLIDKYKDVAAPNFKQQHPAFRVPTTTPVPTTTTTTPAPTTTTPKPTTTTPKPTTTTPKPTTTTPKPTTTTPKPTTTTIPTTAKPTTSTPTTTTATPTTSLRRSTDTSPATTPIPPSTSVPQTMSPTTVAIAMSSTPAPVTYGPISCTTCTGLMCLLASHVTTCPSGQFFCVTSVEETDTGRQISRGCASQSSCDSYNQHQDATLCSQVDHQMLPSGNTCHFCCTGDNCNKPPHVRPPTSSLYLQP